jgi:glycosyltransferase involved in cell wall biosynthesis
MESKLKPGLTIIIPVFNEEANMERIESALLAYIQKTKLPTYVLLVNDGSSDKSQVLIESICERNNRFQYIKFKENRGLSAAIKAGFDFCRTELLAYMDADLQTDPDDLDLLLQHIDQYPMVIGIRAKRKDSLVKKFSSAFANSFRRLFTRDGILDTGCPLKVIRTKNARKIPMFKGLHRFLPALIQLQGVAVKQVPVRHYPRMAGTSKFNVWNRLIGPLSDCFAFLWIRKKYIDYEIEKMNGE